MKRHNHASQRIAHPGGFANVEGGRSALRKMEKTMKRTLCQLLLGTLLCEPAFAVFIGLPVEEQYELAGYVIQAKVVRLTHSPVETNDHISARFTLVECEVSQAFKGNIETLLGKDQHDRIAVACQTQIPEIGPKPPDFQIGREYILFLNPRAPEWRWHSRVFTLVTDGTGSFEATPEMRSIVNKLQQKEQTKQNTPAQPIAGKPGSG